MGIPKDSRRLLSWILGFYAAVFAGRALWSRVFLSVRLETSKPSYLHYDYVDVSLRTRDRTLERAWMSEPPRVAITRDGRTVTTIAGLSSLPLRYDPTRDAFTGRWPCPWNAEAGAYDLGLVRSGDVSDLSGRVAARPFRIERRKPAPLPPGFSVVTLEDSDPWAKLRVKTPDGQEKDWRGLLDWAKYAGADAFWVLGGQTPGKAPGETWVSHNLDLVPEMARECHKRGLKFGVYAMCYLTMSQERLSRYDYAMDVKDGRAVYTRAISLQDERRVDDVIALLKRFRDIPEVDYVGLDYIRNALGGYELAEPFYADMPGVVPPPNWRRLSRDEKVVYFARKKIMRRDLAFVDAWQWWRAHRVALIVRRIKDALGDQKPLWAFTLTWDKGHQHGQDPVMMSDAGIDFDALMLYQADRDQFEGIIRDFHSYVRRGDVQFVVGDVIDWPLHQKSPDGPAELYRRVAEAVDRIYADGPAQGVFFHDLKRALFGRLGPWGARGWLDEARRASEHLRRVSALQARS